MREEAIVAYFEARASRYDSRIKRFIGERELRAVRALVPARSVVLDFGCGTGRTTLDLVRRGCRVTGYDPSGEMIRVAARQVRGLGLDTGCEFVFDEADLASRTWPLVTCVGVLDYYANATVFLSRLRRYLAPGGRIVVSVPNAAGPLGWLYAARGFVAGLPVMPRTVRSLERAAAHAGLAVRAVRHAFPEVPRLALTIVASLALPAESGVTDAGRSNLSRRRPVEFDAPTVRAME